MTSDDASAREHTRSTVWGEFASNWRKLRRSGGFNILKLGWAAAEFGLLVIRGKLFGISVITRYMANPNDLITVPLMRVFGAEIGRGSRIKRRLYLDNVYSDENAAGDFSHIRIGQNCYIGDGVYMDLANLIQLDDNVVLAGNVHFITHADCNRSEFLTKHFPRICEPIYIEEGAWIGYGCTILAGCTIGAHSVLGAGSLLKGDMEKNSVYAGVPSNKVRSLP